MKMVSLSLILAILIAGNSLAATPIAGTKYIFSFGDSYTATGFNISGAKPSKANPIGNPAFPGVTRDNGINWIGHLVKTYNTSETLSYNFAVGGATVDAAIVKGSSGTTPMVTQVAQFTNNVSSKPSYAPWLASNSLFAIWIGINDIGKSYTQNNDSSVLDKVLVRYFQLMQILYNEGGRNFIFLTVPPIDKSPVQLAETASLRQTEKTLISYYNAALNVKVTAFGAANANTTVWVYDTQAPFNLAISNPKAYGAKDATCYNSDGTTCLWWDNYHPGQAIEKLVAEGVATTLKGIFF